MAISVAFADLTVAPMDEELRLVASCDLTRRLTRFALRLVNRSRLAVGSELDGQTLSFVVHFPDGSQAFRFRQEPLKEGDVLWREGQR